MNSEIYVEKVWVVRVESRDQTDLRMYVRRSDLKIMSKNKILQA